MKIGIVSDTHGFTDYVKEALLDVHDLDLIIHLGDYVKDALELEEELGVKVEYVRGNCDYDEVDIEQERILEVEGKKIFMTHGHLYNIKMDLNRIFYRGQELNCDIILFGHSHIPTKVIKQDIIILNPGCAAIPRGRSNKIMGIIEITNGEIESEIITIDQ